jgi:hypothetical protein
MMTQHRSTLFLISLITSLTFIKSAASAKLGTDFTTPATRPYSEGVSTTVWLE